MDGDDLLEELIDIDDTRMKRQFGDDYTQTDLPHMPHLTRIEQREHLAMCIYSSIEDDAKGQHGSALKASKAAVIFSVTMGDAPNTLSAFALVSSGQSRLFRRSGLAATSAERAERDPDAR